METNQPRVYSFGPIIKALVIIAATGLLAIGVWGSIYAYTHLHGVLAQFGGILLAMVPIALALFGGPVVWACRLCLYEDRLEYHGLMLDTVIRKADIIDALSPAPALGMFQIFLTLAGKPFKKLHIAVLGHRDETLTRWVNALPHQKV